MRTTFKTLFSIPGRLRIKVQSPPANQTDGVALCSAIKQNRNIIAARFNSRTHNMLICYQPESMDAAQILAVLNAAAVVSSLELPPKTGVAQRCFQAFKNECDLSKRWLKGSLIIGIAVHAMRKLLRPVIAILILSCPLFFFIAPISAFYYAMQRTKSRKIIVKNDHLFSRLEHTKAVYISDSVLWAEQQRFDFSQSYASSLVFKLRENGITAITAVSSDGGNAINGLAARLGIKQVCTRDALNDNFNSVDNPALFITKRAPLLEGQSSHKNIVLVVYEQDMPPPCWDIAVEDKHLHRIPWLFAFVHSCRDVIIRCQNIAVAINAVWQPVVIKRRIIGFKRELGYGGKSSAGYRRLEYGK